MIIAGKLGQELFFINKFQDVKRLNRTARYRVPKELVFTPRTFKICISIDIPISIE